MLVIYVTFFGAAGPVLAGLSGYLGGFVFFSGAGCTYRVTFSSGMSVVGWSVRLNCTILSILPTYGKKIIPMITKSILCQRAFREMKYTAIASEQSAAR